LGRGIKKKEWGHGQFEESVEKKKRRKKRTRFPIETSLLLRYRHADLGLANSTGGGLLKAREKERKPTTERGGLSLKQNIGWFFWGFKGEVPKTQKGGVTAGGLVG